MYIPRALPREDAHVAAPLVDVGAQCRPLSYIYIYIYIHTYIHTYIYIYMCIYIYI